MQQISKLKTTPSKLLLGVFLFLPLFLFAQDSPKEFKWGLETGPSISFAGANFHLAATAQLGVHEISIGPKWVLSDTYLIARGPWGLDVGYRWNMVRQKKRMAFVGVEYQAAFINSGNLDRKVTVHETHLAYGFQWQLGERWKLGNCLGLGGVVERSRDIISGEVNNLQGFSVLFKIFATAHFGNKVMLK